MKLLQLIRELQILHTGLKLDRKDADNTEVLCRTEDAQGFCYTEDFSIDMVGDEIAISPALD